jgi:hypothetical protein
MSPECLYWVALLALVLPSVPFNRAALVILAVWAFGHLIHMTGGHFEDVAYMFARIVAIGAALALSHPWDGSRRALAQATVALMFIPTALLAAYAAIYFEHPPLDMIEYRQQTAVYWLTWSLMMLQVMAVPVGNDWERIIDLVKNLDDKLMQFLVRRFDGAQ